MLQGPGYRGGEQVALVAADVHDSCLIDVDDFTQPRDELRRNLRRQHQLDPGSVEPFACQQFGNRLADTLQEAVLQIGRAGEGQPGRAAANADVGVEQLEVFGEVLEEEAAEAGFPVGGLIEDDGRAGIL